MGLLQEATVEKLREDEAYQRKRLKELERDNAPRASIQLMQRALGATIIELGNRGLKPKED